MKALPCFLVAIFVLALPLAAQEDQPATKDAQQRIAELIEQQNKLADEYNEAIRNIKAQPEVDKLNQAVENAEAALAKAESSDETLAAARQAEQTAKAALRKAVESQLAEHELAKPQLEQLASLEQKRAEHQWQLALSRFYLDHPLSPISRQLEIDPQLAQLKKAAESATRNQRAAAQQAYQSARSEKISQLEDAKTLLDAIDEASQASEKLTQSILAVQQKLNAIRQQIEAGQREQLAAAQKAIAQAQAAQPLADLRQARLAAIKVYNDKVNALLAEKPEIEKLRQQYQELGRQVRQLRQSDAPKK